MGDSDPGHPPGVTESRAAPGTGDRRLRLCHRAEPSELRSIRRRVETWARRWELSADTLTDLQLALGEAVANGVEHAYSDGRSGTVEVDLVVDDARGVTVRVADHGTWRPPSEHAGHRGRGLLMIDRLARRVRVQSGSWGTEVCFEIPFVTQPVG